MSTAIIESTIRPSKKEKLILEQGLYRLFNLKQPPQLKIKINQSLIAGIKITLNNQVIDLSFKTQLEKLEESLLHE
jgi:F0F1-type ATP synthase delta subunit